MGSEPDIGPVEIEDDLTPERIAQLRADLEIVLESELARAFDVETRTVQTKRVTGKDAFPHFKFGRATLYHVPSVREEIRRRVEGTGSTNVLESIVHRSRPRGRRAG